MAAIDEAVSETENGWDFACPVNDGTCGRRDNRGRIVPFSSTGWPTKKAARERGLEHFGEHKGEGAMSSLEEFRAARGLTPTVDGKRAVFTAKDL